ncbi:hypothetical protein PV326_013534 [Microctonus aethiopoides]|nr:hypothetical protein PV326_013534 [Microctonus aethiopoides]
MLAKNKNPKKLVHRANVVEDAQKAISEYFYSKAADRNIKKYPEWDVARTDPQTKLLKARRELLQAQDELDAKRTEYNEKRQYMDQQWEELRRKEISLRESFIKFDKFVRENREKRERAELKLNEQKERQTKITEEIGLLELKLDATVIVRDKMKRYVNDYKKVQNYLELVVKETENQLVYTKRTITKLKRIVKVAKKQAIKGKEIRGAYQLSEQFIID